MIKLQRHVCLFDCFLFTRPTNLLWIYTANKACNLHLIRLCFEDDADVVWNRRKYPLQQWKKDKLFSIVNLITTATLYTQKTTMPISKLSRKMFTPINVYLKFCHVTLIIWHEAIKFMSKWLGILKNKHYSILDKHFPFFLMVCSRPSTRQLDRSQVLFEKEMKLPCELVFGCKLWQDFAVSKHKSK